jgi:transcriptional regulator with XRE-family HTH domain
MESVGELLRKAREAQGKTIEEVAKITRMSAGTIEALEDDRYNALPAPVYVRSHIRAYARYLGLDEQTVFDRYLRFTQQQETKVPDEWDAVELQYAQSKKSASKRNLLILAAAVVAVVVIVVAVKLAQREPPAGGGDGQAVVEGTPGVAARDTTIEWRKLGLTAIAKQRTWVRVAADGKSLGDVTLAVGERHSWQADREFTLDVGNGGGLDLYLNGEYLGTAGTGPRVVEDLVINENGMSQ